MYMLNGSGEYEGDLLSDAGFSSGVSGLLRTTTDFLIKLIMIINTSMDQQRQINLSSYAISSLMTTMFLIRAPL